MVEGGCRRWPIVLFMAILLSPACASTALAQQSKVKRSSVGAAIDTHDVALDDARLGLHYSQAIMTKIRANWIHAGIAAPDAVCPVKVRQIPGGEVVSVEVMPGCPYDDAGKRSVERAVIKSQPLPYSGFERVFSRTLILRFRVNDPGS